MNAKQSRKRIITEAVLAEIPRLDKPIDKIMFEWWMTGNTGNSLRLTDIGDSYFRLAKIEFYECPIKPVQRDTYYSFIADLSKKIKCPYYMGVNKKEEKSQPYIRLYDSKIAMMLTLYGDLESYLDSIKVRP
jgi:hypothetical protein